MCVNNYTACWNFSTWNKYGSDNYRFLQHKLNFYPQEVDWSHDVFADFCKICLGSCPSSALHLLSVGNPTSTTAPSGCRSTLRRNKVKWRRWPELWDSMADNGWYWGIGGWIIRISRNLGRGAATTRQTAMLSSYLRKTDCCALALNVYRGTSSVSKVWYLGKSIILPFGDNHPCRLIHGDTIL